jgi:multimeric flavodoxin WrbA
MNPEKFVQIKYDTEWYEVIELEDARKQHAKNIQACLEAVEHHNKKDRPLEILAISGSGRSSFASCAQELSNSQFLMLSALDQFHNNPKYHITDVALREYNIEPCNACYSTSSALCGFPCNCFPFDPMQKLYPLVLKCDVMFIATGVNQSTMSSRTKVFLDRLISLDGGFFVNEQQFAFKDAEWRDRCTATATDLAKQNALPYDARMWGRVAAYFISSKDEKNELETVVRDYDEITDLTYIQRTADALREGNADYGFFHDKTDWYAGVWANPNAEMCFDKRDASQHPEFTEHAKRVAQAAVKLAEELRINPIPFDGGARGGKRT